MLPLCSRRKMTQTPHDQLAKQYLEEFLAPFGRIERQYEVPGEAKYVDVWFIPEDAVVEARSDDLGLLGRMTEGMCLLEPYRNAPSRTEVRISIMKLLWVQDDEQRKAKQTGNTLPEADLPKLWILAATLSEPLVEDASGMIKAEWGAGIYFMADLLKVGIIAIDELPETEDTLWLRILGRGKTQERAIREVLALPLGQDRRERILGLLASWKVRMDMSELTGYFSQEETMALTDVLIERDKQIKLEGAQAARATIARTMLQKQMSLADIAEITGLSIEQVQQLQTQN
jgi:hypothetical protein